jgi:predicted transcriptional regulator
MKGKKERCVLTNVIETELEILKRHMIVLNTLLKNEPAGIIKLSELTQHPQHMVRYSLRILEQDGLIEPSPHGAVTTDAVKQTLDLVKRKLKEIKKTVDELLEIIE